MAWLFDVMIAMCTARLSCRAVLWFLDVAHGVTRQPASEQRETCMATCISDLSCNFGVRGGAKT
jgi:hypothetical protein